MRVLGSRWAVVGALVVALAALAVAVAGWSAAGAAGGTGADPPAAGCGSGTPKLTVHGTGTATGTPRVLTVDLSVDVVGSDAQAAMSSDDATTSAVLAALTSGGVPHGDLQTTGLALQPTYTSTGRLTGYSVTNSVVATVHRLAGAGAVVDAAVTAGGNAVRIGSLSFSLADPRAVEDRARHDAVRQAASHAGSMAAAAGERLGPVCSLTDQTSAPPPVYGPAAALGSPSGVTNLPLEPGTQKATAQVTLVYALVGVAAGSP